MTTQDLIDLATEYLSDHAQIHAYDARGIYLHRDDATCAWWMIDADDIELLGVLLNDDAPDAYSRWCSMTTGAEVDPTDVVNDFGADTSTDLDALQAEAGAADDMIGYMALRFLRDDIEEIISENDEIAEYDRAIERQSI